MVRLQYVHRWFAVFAVAAVATLGLLCVTLVFGRPSTQPKPRRVIETQVMISVATVPDIEKWTGGATGDQEIFKSSTPTIYVVADSRNSMPGYLRCRWIDPSGILREYAMAKTSPHTGWCGLEAPAGGFLPGLHSVELLYNDVVQFARIEFIVED